MVLTVPATYAIPTLQLTDGVTTVMIVDGTAADSNPVAGAVTFIGVVGNWVTNVTTGITMPLLGSATLPFMDLNSVDVTSIGGGTLNIMFSEVGFGPLLAPTGFMSDIGGTLNSAAGSRVTYNTYLDAGNVLFATTNLLNSQTFTHPLTAFSGSAGSLAVGPLPTYSLTQDITIVHPGFGSTSLDATTTIPEPGTLMLLGSGLLGMGFLRRFGLCQGNRSGKSADNANTRRRRVAVIKNYSRQNL
jgi:hypothetical protein